MNKRTVQVVNPTPHARYSIVSTLVKFKPGEFQWADWRLEQAEPIGKLHPDGSVSKARIWFPVWLDANSTRQEELPRLAALQANKLGMASASAAPFTLHQHSLVPSKLLGASMSILYGERALNLLDGLTYEIPWHPKLEPDLKPAEAVERAKLVRVYRNSTDHAGAPVWAHLTLEMLSLAPFIRFELYWGLALQTVAEPHLHPYLLVGGCTPAVHAPKALEFVPSVIGPGYLLALGDSMDDELMTYKLSGSLLFPYGDDMDEMDKSILEAEARAPVEVATWAIGASAEPENPPPAGPQAIQPATEGP